MIYIFNLNGRPVPLARARYSRAFKVYDSQKNYKLVAAISLQNQFDYDIIECPISLDVIFYMPIPRYMKKQVDDLPFQPHYIKPDVSNLLKMIEDLLVDAEIIKDDALIWKATATKVYDKEHEPSSIITITKYEYE